MSYVGTVSSLLQSVDSHGLWGGLTVGLPSAPGSGARRRAQGRGSSEIEPRYKTGSVDGICQQTDSRNRFYLDVNTGPKARTTKKSSPERKNKVQKAYDCLLKYEHVV